MTTGNDARFDANSREPATTSAALPAFIGNYAIEPTVLGVGNFATVRLGTHIPTGEQVALKLIDKRSLLPEDLGKIHREIAISRALRHPHVIRTYQTVEDADHIAVVMEYASGGEMYAELTKHGRYDEPEARRLFRQIVAALRYCHSLCVVHRDLKTENLLLDAQKNVKLADFGFSDVMSPGERLDQEWCGSLPYAAPEIFQGHSYDGFKSDSWSLGIVLYVMVTGALPFDGGEDLAVTRQLILSGCFTVPSYVSDDCAALLRALLAVDPAKRCDLDGVMRDRWFTYPFNSKLSTTAYYAFEDGLFDDIAMDDSELNEFVLDEMEKMGHLRESVRLAVVTTPYHDASVTYHLLNDRFTRSTHKTCLIPLPPIPITPSSAMSSRRSSILTGIVVRDDRGSSSSRSSYGGSPSPSFRNSRRSSLPPLATFSNASPTLFPSQSWPINYPTNRSRNLLFSKSHRRASDGSVSIPPQLIVAAKQRNDSLVSDRSYFTSASDCSLSKGMDSLSMEDLNSDEEPDMEAVQRYLSVRGKAMRHTVATGKRSSTSSTAHNIPADSRLLPGTLRRHSDNTGTSRGRPRTSSFPVRPVSPMDEMASLQRHLDSGLGSPSFCYSPATMSPQRQSLTSATSPNLLTVPSASSGTFPARLNAAFQSPTFLDKLYGDIRIKVTPHEFEYPDPTTEQERKE
ncbi:Serine/threonine-protein kinase SIK3 [Hypsibius exemplaris]|uniref:Serine/threonine-protein kinase SIK3 n=1 Tax=Hypsibius exemplaris TaxID=2072580 RepID=A0A1W0WE27_HYPEX|nr:Serine/threonine-protein kinase SIK3 [Hypsibius exemplaris]